MMMQYSVMNGYAITNARAQRRRTSGKSTSALHVDQAMCRLGMAAYWFDTFLRPPDSNDHNVGYVASVSTKPKFSARSAVGGPYRIGGSSTSLGGMSENAAKPTRASTVVNASVLRHRG